MRHERFRELLRRAELVHPHTGKGGAVADGGEGEGRKRTEKKKKGDGEAGVLVQWDPERSPRLARLGYRSIQIGIPGALSKQWAEEWVLDIEDVTERAREMKARLDEDAELTLERLVPERLVPEEREYEVPEDVQRILEMQRDG
jgi:hypothetical protein